MAAARAACLKPDSHELTLSQTMLSKTTEVLERLPRFSTRTSSTAVRTADSYASDAGQVASDVKEYGSLESNLRLTAPCTDFGPKLRLYSKDILI